MCLTTGDLGELVEVISIITFLFYRPRYIKRFLFLNFPFICHLHPTKSSYMTFEIILYLACCIIFYDSAHRYKRFYLLHNVMKTTKCDSKYLCMIVLTILL